MRNDQIISRRLLLKQAGALGLLAAVYPLLPSCVNHTLLPAAHSDPGSSTLRGEVIDLVISERSFTMDGQTGTATTINGTIPGPLIRLREGQDVTIRVTNRLMEDSSIHWHGILLPSHMDGVPGVSFRGIQPGETYSYSFPIKQSGTYWYHSHSGGQELQGMYGPMILDPIEPDPFQYDREYVVMLSEWSGESSEAMMDHLKKSSGYYNFQKRDAQEFVSDAKRWGFWSAMWNYVMWDEMRMDPTDFSDVTGATFSYLMNGLPPVDNWTGLFRQGERVRLRFINAAAMTFYDVRIPGLTMTVVQADGQNVQPVAVEEFRVGPAETYDVLIQPTEDRAYTIFAETMDRSGYARGTLAPRPGMSADIPERRPRPLRTMEDMGMANHGGGHTGHVMGEDVSGMKQSHGDSEGHDMTHGQGLGHRSGMETHAQGRSPIPGATPVKHGPDHHGTGNQTVAEYSRSRMHEPGRGFEQSPRRVLVYTDLKSLVPYADQRTSDREIELHLTGHMQRYMWSFDGKTYSDAPEPIRFRYGERVRLTFVNDTMMEHPLHLHGMWMYLDNGSGAYLPRKHTVVVKPAERLSVVVSADAPGPWAFHCHLLLHMEAGMFRVVQVDP
ncbi:copper resistance system multicopper oxidase [Nitrospira sp. BLG_1]|uniref:copper resistance system multicopper oxidase n=1 Tax=Nitrospira sp. BLG_1 TaxID=3395883 RepID=UPI0039BCEBC1